jgi:hypothetical protein
MKIRSGKYEGYTVNEVNQIDPSYIEWVRENRPEMLKERKVTTKNKVTTSDKNTPTDVKKELPRMGWDEAF